MVRLARKGVAPAGQRRQEPGGNSAPDPYPRAGGEGVRRADGGASPQSHAPSALALNVAGKQAKKRPRNGGAFFTGAYRQPQETFGSLNASMSSLKSLIGTQLQNTFLSP